MPSTGDIASLKLVQETLQAPAPGEIRVAVRAVGLNFADVFTALGLYNAAPKQDVVPGLEFAGVVEHVNSGSEPLQGTTAGPAAPASLAAQAAQQLRVGDRVYGVTRFGAYASHLNVQAHLVRPVPEGWSWPQAAAWLVQGLTAFYGLRELGALQAGHRVLVQSAAGGCGLHAVAICLAVGAIPIGTVGNADKVPFLLQRFPALRAEQVIVRDRGRFADQLQTALQATGAAPGQGFDVVLDAVCGDFFMPAYEALAKGGRHIIYGAADMTPAGDKPAWLRLGWQYWRRPRLDPMAMIGDNKGVLGFNLIWMFDRAAKLMALATELQELNIPPPHVGALFPFEEAPQALRTLQSGQTRGKVVLEVR